MHLGIFSSLSTAYLVGCGCHGAGFAILGLQRLHHLTQQVHAHLDAVHEAVPHGRVRQVIQDARQLTLQARHRYNTNSYARQLCMYVCMHVCMYACMYMYIYIYKHTHIYIAAVV